MMPGCDSGFDSRPKRTKVFTTLVDVQIYGVDLRVELAFAVSV